MLRKIFAGIAGFFATFTTIMFIQQIGHALVPPPADLDMSDTAVASDYIATLSPWMLASVLLAYFAGAFAGPFVAKWLGGGSGKPYAFLFGGLVLAGTLYTVYLITHPAWFTITAAIGIPVAAWAGARFGPRRVSAAAAATE